MLIILILLTLRVEAREGGARERDVDYTDIAHPQSPSFQLNTLNVTVYATLLSTDVAGYTELQGDAILPTAHRQSMNSSEVSILFPNDRWSHSQTMNRRNRYDFSQHTHTGHISCGISGS